MPPLELVSFDLCPYVQRAAIVLAEKQVPFTRTTIDLADKPAWFKAISPLGKVPLLRVGEAVLFESAAICDYLDETLTPQLHPVDAVVRAQHRAWIAVASAILSDIAGYYSAPDKEAFERKAADIRAKVEQVEAALVWPFFAGQDFSLVDAAFAPIFRYFDALERTGLPSAFADFPKIRAWRLALAARPSVVGAVVPDFARRLEGFLLNRMSYLSTLMALNAR
jgi:glutathione S-transferase